MAHVRIWKFRPPKGREQEFTDAYSNRGPWSDLFGRAPGYRGTSLLKSSTQDGRWLTIDRWDSANDFEAFKRGFGNAYGALDAQLEGIAGEEEFVGAFEED